MDLYNLVLSAKITKGEGGGGGDEPTGTKEINITQNGVTTENVKSYASAKITTSVPVGVFPSGTKQISSNGSYDVSNFASAAVNISPIIQSLSISENGTYSVPSGVDGYNPITVNVSGGGGGDHDAEDGMVTRALSEYSNSRVTSIGQNAFNNCLSLTTASFPNVTSIGSSAFYSCLSLTTASFPNATSIGNNAFYNCTKLTTASFPNVTSIGQSAFNNCTSLTIASFPNATSIGNNAFYSCLSLTTASFPLGKSFGNQCFCNCTHLESLYIIASSVATLGTSAFMTTPMSQSSYLGHFGSIYVPASLVNSYKTAANWSTYADRITSYTE